MDPNNCLPPEMTVQSVEDILHRIGLTLNSTKSYPKRKLFFNPIIIFTFMSLFIVREGVITLINEENDLILKVLGSYGYLIGMKREFSILLLLFSILSLSFQLIYYYNYRNGIKPTFLRVFQMMSGLVSPKSLGLTDEQQIRKLLKRTNILLKFFNLNNEIIVPFFAFIFPLTVYSFKTELLEIICYGIPNSVILMIWGTYMNNNFSYQFGMNYIICVYLKMKINSLNERLIEMKRRKRFIRIRETLQSFDSLYSEINEYNTTFWSKILVSFWTLLGTINVFVISVIIFYKFDLITMLVLIYTLSFYGFMFIYLIFKTSSVTYCANKSYKTLNSLIILW